MKNNKELFYKSFIKHIFMLFVCLVISENAYSIQIEKTAETAVAAKTSAINDARRDAFLTVLQEQFSDVEAKKLSEKIMDNELTSMIDSISIENEKSDSTSYSADIIVDFDTNAVNKWLENNGIRKIAETAPVVAGRTPIFFELNNINGFSEIMRISRETNADLKIINISGNRVSASVRENAYDSFVSSVRAAGIIISY